MKTFQNATNKKIYLVRHGLSTRSKFGYGKKKLTARLLPEGKKEIEIIAKYLSEVSDSYNVSSPIRRCRESAEIISAATGKTFVFDKRLSEIHKESFNEFKNRVQQFIGSLASIKESSIIVCTHAAVIASIKHLLTEGTFTLSDKNDYTKEGELAIVSNGEWKIVNIKGLNS